MQRPWERRAIAAHFYSRESVTAMPRIRAAGRVQAWRVGDGEHAQPIYAMVAAVLDAGQAEDLRIAA